MKDHEQKYKDAYRAGRVSLERILLNIKNGMDDLDALDIWTEFCEVRQCALNDAMTAYTQIAVDYMIKHGLIAQADEGVTLDKLHDLIYQDSDKYLNPTWNLSKMSKFHPENEG